MTIQCQAIIDGNIALFKAFIDLAVEDHQILNFAKKSRKLTKAESVLYDDIHNFLFSTGYQKATFEGWLINKLGWGEEHINAIRARALKSPVPRNKTLSCYKVD